MLIELTQSLGRGAASSPVSLSLSLHMWKHLRVCSAHFFTRASHHAEPQSTVRQAHLLHSALVCFGDVTDEQQHILTLWNLPERPVLLAGSWHGGSNLCFDESFKGRAGSLASPLS